MDFVAKDDGVVVSFGRGLVLICCDPLMSPPVHPLAPRIVLVPACPPWRPEEPAARGVRQRPPLSLLPVMDALGAPGRSARGS